MIKNERCGGKTGIFLFHNPKLTINEVTYLGFPDKFYNPFGSSFLLTQERGLSAFNVCELGMQVLNASLLLTLGKRVRRLCGMRGGLWKPDEKY